MQRIKSDQIDRVITPLTQVSLFFFTAVAKQCPYLRRIGRTAEIECTCRGEGDIGERWKETKLIKALQIDVGLFSLSCLSCVCLLTDGELHESICQDSCRSTRCDMLID